MASSPNNLRAHEGLEDFAVFVVTVVEMLVVVVVEEDLVDEVDHRLQGTPSPSLSPLR